MNKIFNYLNLTSQSKIINYFYFILLLFSVSLAISIFYDLLQIHIYRLDSLYYMPSAETYYQDNVVSEGRWVIYLFFNLMVHIPGSILSIFSLLTFGYFVFKVSYQWSNNYYYSIVVSLLFIQIPSFYDLLTWPATATPAFIVLLIATILYKKLNIWIFFIIFGILFFGTMSNYYYLLPLLYLGYLKNKDWQQNIKFLILKLIPAWAIGFVVGYIITQIIVYINFNHFMTIEGWRSPHYIHSFYDLSVNILHSINLLERNIKSIFLNKWIVLLYMLSLIVAIIQRRIDLVFIPLVLFMLIILIHYIVILPIGIVVSPRTVVATWVGVFAIVFFIPDIRNWQMYILVPLILFFASRLYLDNHNNMKWYKNVTNTHYDKLLTEIPKSPSEYKGIILLASRKDIQKRNNLISSLSHTKKMNILSFKILLVDGRLLLGKQVLNLLQNAVMVNLEMRPDTG